MLCSSSHQEAKCGYDGADAVNPEEYSVLFSFTGELEEVVLDLSGDLIQDDEAELKRLMTQQYAERCFGGLMISRGNA